jgi:hypothetical protein
VRHAAEVCNPEQHCRNYAASSRKFWDGFYANHRELLDADMGAVRKTVLRGHELAQPTNLTTEDATLAEMLSRAEDKNSGIRLSQKP